MKRHPAHTLWPLAVGLVMLLAACAVGPNYVRPKTEAPAAFKEMAGWKIAQPRDDAFGGDWWRLFADFELNALEERVMVSNQNLATAEAHFRQALALSQASRVAFFPVMTATPTFSRSLSSVNATHTITAKQASEGNPTISNHLLPLEMTWELDVWGRVRRLNEASRANVQASASDLAAVRLSLQAQLAQSYFHLRNLDGQKEILNATLAAYEKTLSLTRNRYQSGVASRADVLQAETQLRTAQAQAIDIGVQRAQFEHAIALLCGQPAAGFSLPTHALRTTPPPVPVGLPSELLERRPDIAAAERRVAAANAQIGVTIAGYFPTIGLGTSLGYESLELATLLNWPSRFWSVGASMAQTLFQGGLKRAQKAQAQAIYDATVAAYRQTVLTAFQEVEDHLAALRILEREAQVQEEAVRAARQSLEVAINQYKAGTASYLSVTAAQTVSLSSERAALDIQNRRMIASILLVKALGGGWHVSDQHSAKSQ